MNAPVTKQELEQMYGIDKPHRVHDEIVETLTKTVFNKSTDKQAHSLKAPCPSLPAEAKGSQQSNQHHCGTA